MTVRQASNRQPGVNTFYVESDSRPGKIHTVQVIRKPGNRAFFCSCEDFLYRRVTKAGHSPQRSCKHIREVRGLILQAHGVSRVGTILESKTAKELDHLAFKEQNRRYDAEREHRAGMEW